MKSTIEQTPVDQEQHVAVEIMGAMPALRDDLAIRVQVYGGETCYVIEDPIGSKFFRLGIAEYTFVSLLDGRRTIAEAMGQTAAITGAGALSEQEVAGLCKWLIDSGLALTQQSRGASRLSEGREHELGRKAMGHANPLIQKFAIFNPTPILKQFDWLAKIVFSWFAAIVWFAIVCVGSYLIWSDWQRLAGSASNLFAQGNWLWLLLTWGGLKLIHETSHALACRRFRGNVREAGIVFILFAPMPYVDVTSSWRMDSKWKRILISVAGIYAELFCAGIAAIIWFSSRDPLVAQHAINVVTTATVVTLLFNLNPLMRFDGYYILSDWVEMPNLSAHARQWSSFFLRKTCLGIPVQRPEWPEGKHWIVVVYSIAASAWRVLISVSLILGAEVLMHGAGVVLAVFAVLVWVGIPLFKTLKVIHTNPNVDYRRLACVACSLGGIVWACWFVLPWYSHATVPIVVDYHPAREVRIGVSGFLTVSNARIGSNVRQGDVLAKLSNRDLEIELENLKLEIEQSKQRLRQYRFDGEIAASQVEQRNQDSLNKRLAQIQRQCNSLVVRAPCDGIIAKSNIEDLVGTAMKAGDPIVTIGSEKTELIYGLVSQNEADAFRSRVGDSINIHIWGTGAKRFQGTISRVLPRASTELEHAALGAHAGGPLTVRPKEDANQNDRHQWELTEPKFPVLVDFAGCKTESVMPGQVGYASMIYRNGTVGKITSHALSNWIQKQRQMMLQLTKSAR